MSRSGAFIAELVFHFNGKGDFTVFLIFRASDLMIQRNGVFSTTVTNGPASEVSEELMAYFGPDCHHGEDYTFYYNNIKPTWQSASQRIWQTSNACEGHGDASSGNACRVMSCSTFMEQDFILSGEFSKE